MAEPVTEGHTITLTGAWNIRIFSPEWVATHLAPHTEIGLAVAVGNPAAPLRLQFRGIYLHVGAERLVLTPVELNDASLLTIQEVATQIVRMLPHTPVTGVGINFQYAVDEPEATLLDAFRVSDNGAIGDYGAEIISTTIRQMMRIDARTLNLILVLTEGGTATIEFNNHSSVTNGEAALAALQTPIITLRDQSIDALRSIYALEVGAYDAVRN